MAASSPQVSSACTHSPAAGQAGRTPHCRQIGARQQPLTEGPFMRWLAFAVLLLLPPAGAARADCKDDIIALLDRSTLAGPYRTTANVTANDRKATIVSTIVPPGDMHSRTT